MQTEPIHHIALFMALVTLSVSCSQETTPAVPWDLGEGRGQGDASPASDASGEPEAPQHPSLPTLEDHWLHRSPERLCLARSIETDARLYIWEVDAGGDKIDILVDATTGLYSRLLRVAMREVFPKEPPNPKIGTLFTSRPQEQGERVLISLGSSRPLVPLDISGEEVRVETNDRFVGCANSSVDEASLESWRQLLDNNGRLLFLSTSVTTQPGGKALLVEGPHRGVLTGTSWRSLGCSERIFDGNRVTVMPRFHLQDGRVLEVPVGGREVFEHSGDIHFIQVERATTGLDGYCGEIVFSLGRADFFEEYEPPK